MAANFWRTVLALQVALAIAIAFGVSRIAPGLGAWPAIATAIAVFVAMQYLLVALTIVLSRALAGPAGKWSLLQTARVALGEPVYFALAQLAMIAAPLPSPCMTKAHGSARPTLLLVHGFACNWGVWHWLLPRLRAAGFDCIHAVNLEPVRADIDVLARRLEHAVLSLHADENTRITIVAHSMGGLVARAALRSLVPGRVRHIVTIGTPHHGAAIARAVRGPPPQLRTDSSWLASLNTLQEGRLAVPVTSICSLDDNLVQPPATSSLQGASMHRMRGLGHFGLLISRRATDCVLRALKDAA